MIHTDKHTYHVKFIDDEPCNLKLLFNEINKIDRTDILERNVIVNDSVTGRIGVIIKKLSWMIEKIKIEKYYIMLWKKTNSLVFFINKTTLYLTFLYRYGIMVI